MGTSAPHASGPGEPRPQAPDESEQPAATQHRREAATWAGRAVAALAVLSWPAVFFAGVGSDILFIFILSRAALPLLSIVGGIAMVWEGRSVEVAEAQFDGWVAIGSGLMLGLGLFYWIWGAYNL